MIKLMEIMGAKNFWMLPNGHIEEVCDHLGWVTDNVDLPYYHDEDGFPITKDGSIAEESDVYDAAYRLGYVRLVKEAGSGPLFFDYFSGLNNVQKRSIRDFAIEKGWRLFDAITKKEIDLT